MSRPSLGKTGSEEIILGIDLGTTNSEVAAYTAQGVRVLGPEGGKMLPSCVGISPAGELLVGQAARNQQMVFPERTVRSVKRKMGTGERVSLGNRAFTPQEISALILRELAVWAEASLGRAVKKAVITVPAYFSDAQRNATREAGALAGLEVVRILNEPTAASLAYGQGGGERQTVMIYDLGGGTFDISIVEMQGDVTEVLSSHGNNLLGGDDFSDLLAGRLLAEFKSRHGIDLKDSHPASFNRLWWAAEEAKKRLSSEPFVKIREDALVIRDGKPLHLEMEVSREDYESLIGPLVESTMESVAKALSDAKKRPGDLDAILLVGGSTRTPLVSEFLEENAGQRPRQDIHPDLCVALGAGVLASRLGGFEVNRVLVDVTPYSFGVSYLGERDGYPYEYCYKPIIEGNTPIPATRTEAFYTVHSEQDVVQIEVFQGDDQDAMKNIPVGSFRIEGLTTGRDRPNDILCQMRIDLDGILKVTAIEKCTGKSKQISISNALPAASATEISRSGEALERLHATRKEKILELFSEDSHGMGAPGPTGWEPMGGAERMENGEAEAGGALEVEAGKSAGNEHLAEPKGGAAARQVLEKIGQLMGKMAAEDREDARRLQSELRSALDRKDQAGIHSAMDELNELIYFVEEV